MFTAIPRVMIVCPQTLLREGLGLLLAQDEDLQIVGKMADLGQAIEDLHQTRPDVVIVASADTPQNCHTVVKRLKADRPALPVLVLSPDTHPEHVQAVLAAGATGYLTLEAHPDELIRAVNTVSRGELTLYPKVVFALLASLAGQLNEEPTPDLDDLSPREQEVLACLAHGLTDRDIAQQLFVSVRTVQTHLAHIYAKLDVHSRTEAALIAVQADWFPARGESSPENQ